MTPTPIAISSHIRFDELAELADLSKPSAAAIAAPLQSLPPTAGSICLLRRLFNSSSLRPIVGGTANAYILVFVATASSASLSPSAVAVRVRSAQLSGLNLEKLST